MYRNATSAAILMADRVNPLKPEGYWLHEAGMVGYVVAKKGSKTIEFWTSHGGLDSAFDLGKTVEAHHDQSRRTKGYWTVIGRVDWTDDGVISHGEVPNRILNHGVFK